MQSYPILGHNILPDVYLYASLRRLLSDLKQPGCSGFVYVFLTAILEHLSGHTL
jgi:hypothetical protein